jgi:Protein of unknown function (DUF2442)
LGLWFGPFFKNRLRLPRRYLRVFALEQRIADDIVPQRLPARSPWIDDRAVARAGLTSRRFKMHGTATLGAEVTNVSAHCFWLLLGDEELAVPFADFPWFKKATIEQLSDVQRPTEDHLYWPQLDVDLSIESIRKPDNFPLVSRSGER